MKTIKLLSDGGYSALDNVPFPVEVQGEYRNFELWAVKGSELIRVGADPDAFDPEHGYVFDEDAGEVSSES